MCLKSGDGSGTFGDGDREFQTAGAIHNTECLGLERVFYM